MAGNNDLSVLFSMNLHVRRLCTIPCNCSYYLVPAWYVYLCRSSTPILGAMSKTSSLASTKILSRIVVWYFIMLIGAPPLIKASFQGRLIKYPQDTTCQTALRPSHPRTRRNNQRRCASHPFPVTAGRCENSTLVVHRGVAAQSTFRWARFRGVHHKSDSDSQIANARARVHARQLPACTCTMWRAASERNRDGAATRARQ